MPAPLFLVASLLTFQDERLRPPTLPSETCVELRQFRGGGRGGCRAAVDPSIAWMCFEQESGGYDVRFKTSLGSLVKEYSYEKKNSEDWGGHVEIFFTSTDHKKNPDLRIGLADQKDGTVVISKSRLCIPAASAKTIER